MLNQRVSNDKTKQNSIALHHVMYLLREQSSLAWLVWAIIYSNKCTTNIIISACFLGHSWPSTANFPLQNPCFTCTSTCSQKEKTFIWSGTEKISDKYYIILILQIEQGAVDWGPEKSFANQVINKGNKSKHAVADPDLEMKGGWFTCPAGFSPFFHFFFF